MVLYCRWHCWTEFRRFSILSIRITGTMIYHLIYISLSILHLITKERNIMSIVNKMICVQLDSIQNAASSKRHHLRQRFTTVLAPSPHAKRLLISYQVKAPTRNNDDHGSISFAFVDEDSKNRSKDKIKND